jgi:UDP-N-acetylmuramate--alanine ligase
MYNKIKQIHFIGIGGIGMSGIAELLQRHGYSVSGSDLKESDSSRHLSSIGVKICIGHRAQNINGAELIVYSSAVTNENPEMAAAFEKEIPVIRRAEMLAELMRMKYGVAVAGAHGKTTTTSMISLALMEGGLDPTIVVGGRMDNFGGTNARMGNGEFMVVEADESDGSFNKLTPSIAIVTNLDREHMDHYKNMASLKKAFLSFMNKVPFYGLCVFCGDDPSLKLLCHKVERRKKSYGFSEGNHYQVLSYNPGLEETICEIRAGEEKLTLKLKVPGRHNVLNALATLAVADELGIEREKTLGALAKFQGVQRRFQKKGEVNGVLLIDDYAHHPSEIMATLRAARERFPKKKIRVVFQPHRFTRVEDLLDEFATCFKYCDSVVITDIYAAGETPIPGVHGKVVAESIRKDDRHDASYIPTPLEAVRAQLAKSAPGDVLITLGAGDLPHVYRQLI